MKIGINARTFHVDQPDGAVQSAKKITKALGSIDNVNLILFGDASLDSDFENIDAVQSWSFISQSQALGTIWERTVLPLLCYRERPDVLVCPNGNAPLTPIGCPIVTYVHDINAQKNMSSLIHGMYRKSMVPLAVKNSDMVVTVSKFSKEEIVNSLPVDQNTVEVVYNGIDRIYLEDDDGLELDLPEDYLLYVGAMNPRKNVGNLIKAYHSICDKIPHQLVVIGPENKKVYKKIGNEEFSDIVTPGFVSKPELKYAYRNASAFVYPSLYEGFGIPPLEALACGTPVIASNRASLPEILDGHATFVNPLETDEIAEAMIDVVNTEDKLNMDRKQYAKKFTWDRAASELLQLLKRF